MKLRLSCKQENVESLDENKLNCYPSVLQAYSYPHRRVTIAKRFCATKATNSVHSVLVSSCVKWHIFCVKKTRAKISAIFTVVQVSTKQFEEKLTVLW